MGCFLLIKLLTGLWRIEMNEYELDKKAYFWAYKLLPNYIKILKRDAENQEIEEIKSLLEERLKEVEKDYEEICAGYEKLED